MKFKYGDVVEVKDGFYKGQKGLVFRYETVKSFLGTFIDYKYQVELVDDTIYLFENELKLVKREEEKNGTH